MLSSVNIWVGLDVHKEAVTAAVFRNRDAEPMRVDRLPYDLKKIRRYFERLQAGALCAPATRRRVPATCSSARSPSGASHVSSPPRRSSPDEPASTARRIAGTRSRSGATSETTASC